MTVSLFSKILPANATNKTLTYISYSPKIATVTNTGIIKGVSVGYAEIVAMTSDSSNIVFYIPVNVLSYFIPVNGIYINQTGYNMNVNKNLQLISYVFPRNATFTEIKWSSSDNSIATVTQNGLVTSIKLGKAVITSTSIYDAKYIASCSINVK